MASAPTMVGHSTAPEQARTVPPLRRFGLPLAMGVLGASLMLGIYLGIVTWAQGWAQALDLLDQDKFLVIPIVVGFGTQVGLYTYLRRAIRAGAKGAGALTGATGGTSTAAMVACCAHRVADVLPLLGLTAAANFLAAYKTPFLVFGLTMTLIGVGVTLRMIIKHRAHLSRMVV